MNYYGGLIGDFKHSNTDKDYNLTNQAADLKGYWTNKPWLSQGSFSFNDTDGTFRFFSSNGDSAGTPFKINGIEAPSKNGYRSISISINGIQKKRDTNTYKSTHSTNGKLLIYGENGQIGEIFFCHISGSQIRVMKVTGASSNGRNAVNSTADKYWGAVSASLNLESWHSIQWTLNNDGTQTWKINGTTINQTYAIDTTDTASSLNKIWNTNRCMNSFRLECTASGSSTDAARYTRIRTPITVSRTKGPVALEFGPDDGDMYTKTHDPKNRTMTYDAITDNTGYYKAFEFN